MILFHHLYRAGGLPKAYPCVARNEELDPYSSLYKILANKVVSISLQSVQSLLIRGMVGVQKGMELLSLKFLLGLRGPKP